jgi:hypothetical protein
MGLAMLLTCIFFVGNAFGLVALLLMGILLLAAGWRLSSFWIGELYALLATTTCLNAVISIQVLFFFIEANIGGVVQSSDAEPCRMLPKYMLGSGLQCGWCWLFG